MNDTSGPNYYASFAQYDPTTSSWKTYQGTLPWGSDKYSDNWPRAGMTRNGTAYQLPPSAPLTNATAYGSLPTPRTADGMHHKLRKNITNHKSRLEDYIAQQTWPTPRANKAQTTKLTPNTKNRPHPNLETIVHRRHPNKTGHYLNPQFTEQLMGFPADWTNTETDTAPSETQ